MMIGVIVAIIAIVVIVVLAFNVLQRDGGGSLMPDEIDVNIKLSDGDGGS